MKFKDTNITSNTRESGNGVGMRSSSHNPQKFTRSTIENLAQRNQLDEKFVRNLIANQSQTPLSLQNVNQYAIYKWGNYMPQNLMSDPIVQMTINPQMIQDSMMLEPTREEIASATKTGVAMSERIKASMKARSAQEATLYSEVKNSDLTYMDGMYKGNMPSGNNIYKHSIRPPYQTAMELMGMQFQSDQPTDAQGIAGGMAAANKFINGPSKPVYINPASGIFRRETGFTEFHMLTTNGYNQKPVLVRNFNSTVVPLPYTHNPQPVDAYKKNTGVIAMEVAKTVPQERYNGGWDPKIYEANMKGTVGGNTGIDTGDDKTATLPTTKEIEKGTVKKN